MDPPNFPVSQPSPLLLSSTWNFSHFILPNTGLCIICFFCLDYLFLSSLPYKLLFLCSLVSQRPESHWWLLWFHPVCLCWALIAHCTCSSLHCGDCCFIFIYVILWLMTFSLLDYKLIKDMSSFCFPSTVPGTEYCMFVEWIYNWKNEWTNEHRR